MKRLRLKDIVDTHTYLKGEVELLEEDVPNKDDKEFQALFETCKDLTMRYIKSSETVSYTHLYQSMRCSVFVTLHMYFCPVAYRVE